MDPIIRRKFAVPEVSRSHLARERLLAVLEGGTSPHVRLTLVQGGPGAGKSRLLAQYARRRGLLACFYRLTAAEREPLVFGRHLLAGLSERLGFVSERPGQLLAAKGAAGMAAAFGLLCDELAAGLDRPLALILDDWHWLPDLPEVTEAIEALIQFFPESSQLLLSGRPVAADWLAAYRLRGELVEIGDGDLAFTCDEIAALWEVATGKPPAAEVARRVLDRTRGWAIAVSHSVRLSASRQAGDAVEPAPFHAYLAQEVLPALDPTFRRQLLLCAHLPRLDRESCQIVLGEASDGFLAKLAHLGMFAAQVGDSWEFHPLLREFLVRTFADTLPEAERRDILGRLAAAAACPEERVGFLQAARDWERAEAELVMCLPALLAQGWLTTGRRLLDDFPAGRLEASPALRFVEGSMLVRGGEAMRGAAVLREAERLAEIAGDAALLGQIWAALSTAHTLLGDTELQGRYAELGLGTLPPDALCARAACLNSRGLSRLSHRELDLAEKDFSEALALCRRGGLAPGEVNALHNLGFVASWRGAHGAAIDRYRRSVERARLAGILPLPLTCANLALSCLYLGRYAECRAAIEEGLGLADGSRSVRDRSYLLWAAGLLHQRQGDTGRARESLSAALAAAGACGDRQASCQALLGLAQLALDRGDLDEAQIKLALAIGMAGKPLEDPELLGAATIQADLLLRRGDLERAGSWLAHASRCLEQRPNPYHECWVERLLAAWHRCRGDRAGEREHADRMRSLAERHGYPVPGDWPTPLPQVDPRSVAAMRVSCFEPFEVEIGTRSVGESDWVSANSRVVLAYLALHPAGATRQELAELLYPGRQISRSAISTVVSRLRDVLEPECRQDAPSRFLLLADGRYRLAPGTPVWCDAAEFLRLLEQAGRPGIDAAGRTRLLERAIALYRGPFLQAFRDLPWVGAEAGRLRGLALAACEELLRTASACEDWPALERHAGEALRMDPCYRPAIKARVVAIALQERLEEARRSAEALASAGCGCAEADPEIPALASMLRCGQNAMGAFRAFLPPARGD